MTAEVDGLDLLLYRVLQTVYQTQTTRNGRGVDPAEVLDYVSHGAILRRMAPDRLTVVRCLRMLVEVGYLRIDRWSKYRLTPEGWADGLSRAPEDFPWGT